MKRLFVALLLCVLPFMAFAEETAPVAQPTAERAASTAAFEDPEAVKALHAQVLQLLKHMTDEQLAAIVNHAEDILVNRENDGVPAEEMETALASEQGVASEPEQGTAESGATAQEEQKTAQVLGDCVSHPMMHPCPEIQHLELDVLVADSTENVIEQVVADNERLASLPVKPESFRVIENEETGAKNLFAVVPGELVRTGDGPYHWQPTLWKESVDLKANAYDDISPDHAFLKLWYQANNEFNPELANSPARMGGWNDRLMYHPKDTEVGAMLIPLLTLNEAQEAQVTQWMESDGEVLTVALEHR